MPRRAQGPRLYLRKGRVDARTGKRVPDLYYIRDGQTERGTGCGLDRLAEAERKLSTYIAEKWSPAPADFERSGDPARILVSDVLAYYSAEHAPKVADPGATASRLKALLLWWQGKHLSDVRRSTCQAYVQHRMQQSLGSATTEEGRRKKVTAQGARRELEDLSAAIGFWNGEHTLIARPKVWLPEKPESPRDALTRSQAARLLMAARGYRWTGRGWKRLEGSIAANRAHLKRAILIGLYTGTRPGLLPRVLWEESPVAPWVDVAAGIVYRRGRDEKVHKTKRRPLVRVPRRLAAHLRRWKAADALWHEKLREEKVAPPATVLHHGARPIAGKLRRGFASCVRDAGLSSAITPHWLRHTCATWLMEADVPIWDVAAYTGMTVKTLETHYGHHRPGHQQRARRAL
jgi:integrase